MTEKYIGTKIITAEPCQAGEEDKRGKYPVGADGYRVTYEDGHQSWSPKEVFDAAYRKANGMPFGLAVESLKQGKKVARTGWNGKGMWLVYVAGDVYEVARDVLISIDAPDRTNSNFLPWIGMKTAENKFVPWLASQTDVLAEDWSIVE